MSGGTSDGEDQYMILNPEAFQRAELQHRLEISAKRSPGGDLARCAHSRQESPVPTPKVRPA